MKKKYAIVIRLLLLVGVAGVLALTAQAPSMTASAALPPRPTPSPTPIPTLPPTPTSAPAPTSPPTATAKAAPPQAISGAILQLQVNFAPAWPWDTAHWQTLWTIVQWQDDLGNWHDVKSWQGSLDERVYRQGYKTWWVAAENLGQGPFRWTIYKNQGGELLNISAPFNLPATAGEHLTVQVSLD